MEADSLEFQQTLLMPSKQHYKNKVNSKKQVEMNSFMHSSYEMCDKEWE